MQSKNQNFELGLQKLIGLSAQLPQDVAQLAQAGGFTWATRLLGFDEGTPGRVRLNVAGDGLNLSQKAQFEAFLKVALADTLPEFASSQVYFVKTLAASSPVLKASAAEASSSATPTRSGAQGASSADTASHRDLGSAKAPFTKKAIPGVKRILAVASGKGGVGKSTVSVNLAIALHNQGYKVGILDADIYGPSLPMMLGVREDPKVNSNNKIVPPEAFGLKVMSFGFFSPDDSAVIWRGPMVMKALQQFFYDVQWGDLDFLVIDLPPGTGDAQLTLVQSLPIQGAVIVTTPQNVALLDASKGVAMFRKTGVPVLGIVENMSTFHCPSCGVETAIFGSGGASHLCKQYEVPLLGTVPLVSELRESGDAGKPLAAIAGHPMRLRFAEIADTVFKAMFAQ